MNSDSNIKFSLRGKRVWITGHLGMVGAGLIRRLERENCEILTTTRAQLDLKRQTHVEEWMAENKPQAIFMAAATVGGIHANDTYPVDFLYDNIMIEANIIQAAHEVGVEKLLFLGSSCIYPKSAQQPMTENALLTGPLELTNEWYAVAKITGIKLCEAYYKQYNANFISAMPTNLYGPGDNFHYENSHVIPALIRKTHDAKQAGDQTIEIWGKGLALREFMHVDDCADALVYLMCNYSGAQHINVGCGSDVAIEGLARLIMKVVGFTGDLTKDDSRPDGTLRKLMDSSNLAALGWTANINLERGLIDTYQWFLDNQNSYRR